MTPATRHAIYLSMLGYMEAHPDASASTVSNVYRNNPDWASKGLTSGTALTIAEAARQSARLASQMMDEPQAPHAPRAAPIRVGIQPDAPLFEYSVFVGATDRGGSKVGTRIEVVSDVPLSWAEIRALALESLPRTGTAGKREVRQALAADPLQAPETALVGVARRGG